MKICPTCQRKYAQSDLNFCLDDGALLQPFQESVDSAETIQINSPATNPFTTKNPFTPQSGAPGGQPSSQQPAFQQKPQQYSVQPVRKTSKAWLWAVGALALVMIICGGGLGVLMFIGKLAEKSNANYDTQTNSPIPGNSAPVNKVIVPLPPSAPRKIAFSDNLSKWQAKSASGITEYKNGTLLMASKAKGFYYIQLGGDKYTSENANVKVTIANPFAASSDLGYGLILHSSPVPFEKDYAFLIDSIGGRYRIVYHTPGDENAAVDWKDSTAINKGAAVNIIEMRDANGSMEFYINNQKVETMANTHGYKGGVAGLYSGDGVKAAFSNLEIYR